MSILFPPAKLPAAPFPGCEDIGTAAAGQLPSGGFSCRRMDGSILWQGVVLAAADKVRCVRAYVERERELRESARAALCANLSGGSWLGVFQEQKKVIVGGAD